MEICLHKTQTILMMEAKREFEFAKAAPIWQHLPREKESFICLCPSALRRDYRDKLPKSR